MQCCFTDTHGRKTIQCKHQADQINLEITAKSSIEAASTFKLKSRLKRGSEFADERIARAHSKAQKGVPLYRIVRLETVSTADAEALGKLSST